jgi:hypothetical protein
MGYLAHHAGEQALAPLLAAMGRDRLGVARAKVTRPRRRP